MGDNGTDGRPSQDEPDEWYDSNRSGKTQLDDTTVLLLRALSLDTQQSLARAANNRDKRIIKTGCAAENEALVLCHADKKDWRLCLKEVHS